MGWAARAKISAGNPVDEGQRYRYVQDSAHRKATANGQRMRCDYSDRAYSMDRHGTLRRVLVIDRRPVVTIRECIEEAEPSAI